MSFFNYRDGLLHAEDVPIPAIASTYGTPAYIYSRRAIEHQWHALDSAFGNHPHLICYAVKANSNLGVLSVLAKLGSGFDIVSGGELQRVLAAGGEAEKIVFSGVAKSVDEICAALQCGEQGVRCINIESHAELERIQEVAAKLGKIARIGVRVNPDVDARTHPYIATGLETAKFGLTVDAAVDAYRAATSMPNIAVHSIACHIGSQITELQPFADAVTRIAKLVARLRKENIELQQLDLGGGLGINYQGEAPPTAQDYVDNLLTHLKKENINLPVAIEPGRYIVGNAGVLLTKIEYLKQTPNKNFAIVDAGMNDLLRPSLYQAHHDIVNVHEGREADQHWDIVGPVCESSDVLGHERQIGVLQGDLLAIKSAGAYAFVMASNYNSRPRPPEIMVSGDKITLVRARETFSSITAEEQPVS